MESYPLSSLTVEEATRLQFKIVDAVTRHFDGREVLSQGDLGIPLGIGKPETTKKVEAVFAEVFGGEAAVLVRGAGTGALRWALGAVLRPGDALLVHTAPVYPSTKHTLESFGVELVAADFNDEAALAAVLREQGGRLKAALVQHTRQRLEDSYDFGGVIGAIKEQCLALPVITDDNYAALKVSAIGCGHGAELATFSCFKTLGPEGIGVIIGKQAFIEPIVKQHYSGGCQVQGHEAMEALRGIVYAPVSLAISAAVCDEVAARLNAGELPEVKKTYIVNAQSKVLVVEFYEEIAAELLKLTPKYGGAAHPVGCESKYEMSPLIYRVSGTFRAQDPTLERRMIRINPLRCGGDTIVRILRSALDEWKRNEQVCF